MGVAHFIEGSGVSAEYQVLLRVPLYIAVGCCCRCRCCYRSHMKSINTTLSSVLVDDQDSHRTTVRQSQDSLQLPWRGRKQPQAKCSVGKVKCCTRRYAVGWGNRRRRDTAAVHLKDLAKKRRWYHGRKYTLLGVSLLVPLL